MRVVSLLGVWAIALMLAALLTFPSPMAIVFLDSFPEGLVFGRSSIVERSLGWLVYAALTGFAVRTADRTRYTTLFILLCVLLTINVAGCKYIADHTRLPHTVSHPAARAAFT
jgi:hypothetical protein